MNLRLDWASPQAARYACMNWHYSHKIPVFRSIRIGVWEEEIFRGVVLFGDGATRLLSAPFGIPRHEVCELTRVALRSHVTPVSRILAIAIKMLKKKCPGIRLLVSFADSEQGHHGGIYQASGWVYTGSSYAQHFIVNGQRLHPKTVHGRWGPGGIKMIQRKVDSNATLCDSHGKHRYAMPLDKEVAAIVNAMKQPYPKRLTSIGADASPDQGEEGGSQPTVRLHE